MNSTIASLPTIIEDIQQPFCVDASFRRVATVDLG